MCDSKGNLIGDFSSFVKPKHNKRLTKFCKNLTNISQDDISSAKALPYVISNMYEWAFDSMSVDLSLALWLSWGGSDPKILQKDCKRHEIESPFSYHYCLQTLYREATGEDCGLRAAVEREGFDWLGDQHRAFFDAQNSICIFQKILEHIKSFDSRRIEQD